MLRKFTRLSRTVARRGLATSLADRPRADTYVLITFPLHGLGGRGKGMSDHYEARFGTLVAGMAWIVRRFELPGERAFLLSR